jgi:hypothetical protein
MSLYFFPFLGQKCVPILPTTSEQASGTFSYSVDTGFRAQNIPYLNSNSLYHGVAAILSQPRPENMSSEWEHRKERIISLYCDQRNKLDDVIAVMQIEGFSAR